MRHVACGVVPDLIRCLPARSGCVVTYSMRSLQRCCEVLHQCSPRQPATLQQLRACAQRATDVD
eukprot:8630673-Prorocentrum_lima.AAC.1